MTDVSLTLTRRELEVLRELVLFVDVDVASFNLQADGLEVTSNHELNELGTKLQRELDRPRFFPPPDPDSAPSYDEIEDAGLDGTLRDM